MIAALTLVGSTLAAVQPCPAPQTPDTVQVGLDFHNHKLGGIGLPMLDGDQWSMTLLSPVGLELFSVEGPPNTVRSAPESWAPWLERLPFERDLRVAFTPVTEGRCRVAGGTIRGRVTEDGVRRKWRGPGGGVKAVVVGGRVEMRDRRRGYALLWVVDDGA